MRTENYPKGTGIVVSFKIYKRVIKDYIREIVCNFFFCKCGNICKIISRAIV